MEKHAKQVSGFKLDTELLIEMLTHVSHKPQESDLQPSVTGSSRLWRRRQVLSRLTGRKKSSSMPSNKPA